MILNGLGGQALSQQHALNSAALMNVAQPEYLATLVVSFPKARRGCAGNFPSWEPLSVLGLMQEMELFAFRTGAETDHIPHRPRLELADPERDAGERISCGCCKNCVRLSPRLKRPR